MSVISLGIGQRFGMGLTRLEAGLKANGYEGEIHLFREYPEGCPTHREIPYGFKPWLLDWARRRGDSEALWMDSACVPVKSLDRVFALMRRQGYVFPYSPLRIGEWCSDAALNTMGLTREKVMGLWPSIWATVMGLNFRNALANEFLDRWLAKSRDGVSFHGDWTNENGQVSSDPRVQGHRHDQTIATILAFQMGLTFSWGVVCYDSGDVMPLEGFEERLRLPGFPTPILSNHNVKTGPHSNGEYDRHRKT